MVLRRLFSAQRQRRLREDDFFVRGDDAHIDTAIRGCVPRRGNAVCQTVGDQTPFAVDEVLAASLLPFTTLSPISGHR